MSPNPVPEREDLEVQVAVTNPSVEEGGADSPNTVVRVNLPRRQSVLNVRRDGEILPFSEWDSEYVEGLEVIIIDVGTLAAGETVVFEVRSFNSAEEGPYSVGSDVTGDLEDPDTSDNSVVTSFFVGSASVDLQITKEFVEFPDNSTFYLRVKNLSDEFDSPGTVVTDYLPEGTTVNSVRIEDSMSETGWTETPNGEWNIETEGLQEKLIIPIGTLPKSTAKELSIRVSLPTKGIYSNLATISSALEDPDLENNEDRIMFAYGLSADISSSIDAPEAIVQGTQFSVEFTVTNNGPDEALDAGGFFSMDYIVDEFPIPVTDSLEDVTSNAEKIDAVAGRFSITKGILAAGESIFLTITTTADDSSSVVSTEGNGSSKTDDPVSFNNASGSQIAVLDPQSSQSLWPGEPGDKLTGLGWINDTKYPYVWSYTLNRFLYIAEDFSTLDNIWGYDLEGEYWFWTHNEWGGWYYNASNPSVGIGGWINWNDPG